MKIYRVGGAVRDKYLNLPTTEHDWLVVGATANELLAQGYQCVGKDFPVFLHPTTKEEYALARTERKSGRGYTGFVFNSDPSVTLEEDLIRRDLTINAMAEDEHGKLYDPHHGLTDLQNKLLRHVSPAFAEDPVRILRIARFSARFAHLGFSIATETETLMKQMVADGEVDALVAERVWQELNRALTEKTPAIFFQVLQDCGALAILFPELTPHYAAALRNLVTATNLASDPKVRFAALLSVLPELEIKKLCARYRVPNDYQELVLLTQKNLGFIKQELTAETMLNFLETTDAFRRPARWQELLLTLTTLGLVAAQKNLLEQVFTAAKEITIHSISAEKLTGNLIGAEIHTARLTTIQSLLKSQLVA
jgi:tRNA nucleotidyltransferase (CCA-adding enzyme)